MARLLSESKADLHEFITTYLCITDASDWNTVFLANEVLKFYAMSDVESGMKIFGDCYVTALEEFAKSDNDEKATVATERLAAIDQILKAHEVKRVFLHHHKESMRKNGVLQVEASLLQEATSKIASSSKTPKKAFKEMNVEEKTMYLIKKVGENGTLDFSLHRVPSRFAPAMKEIRAHFSTALRPLVTLEERRALLQFSNCNTPDDVANFLADMFAKRNVTSNIAYIRSAVDGLQQLWESNHLQCQRNDEGWYRQNVYSFIWDRLFLHHDSFYTKRAECLSAVIKELQETEQVAQQRLDFILRNVNDRSDYMTAEEKPEHKDIKCDIKKGRTMREHMLQLWKNKLGSTRLANELEAITCQWQGVKLKIYGTRMVQNNQFLSYVKRHVSIPRESGHYAAAAEVLLAMLSLKQHATLNYARFAAMLEEKQKIDLETLTTSDNDFCLLRDDSVEHSFESEGSLCRIDSDVEKRILAKCRTVRLPTNLVCQQDWEKMLVDDVKNQVPARKRQRQY